MDEGPPAGSGNGSGGSGDCVCEMFAALPSAHDEKLNKVKSVSCLGIINHFVLWQAEQLASKKIKPMWAQSTC